MPHIDACEDGCQIDLYGRRKHFSASAEARRKPTLLTSSQPSVVAALQHQLCSDNFGVGCLDHLNHLSPSPYVSSNPGLVAVPKLLHAAKSYEVKEVPISSAG